MGAACVLAAATGPAEVGAGCVATICGSVAAPDLAAGLPKRSWSAYAANVNTTKPETKNFLIARANGCVRRG